MVAVDGRSVQVFKEPTVGFYKQIQKSIIPSQIQKTSKHVFHIFENHLLVVEFVSGVVGGCLATVYHATVWGKIN